MNTSRFNVIPSVNRLVQVPVETLCARSDEFRVKVEYSKRGSCLIDAGIHVQGGLEAGRGIADSPSRSQICFAEAV